MANVVDGAPLGRRGPPSRRMSASNPDARVMKQLSDAEHITHRRYQIANGEYEWTVSYDDGRQWVPFVAVVAGAAASAIVMVLRTMQL